MSRVGVYAGAGAALAAAVLLAAARVGEEPGALSSWQALVLGLVQGATELLPISSSGHLILVPWLANWTYLEAHDSFNQTFDVALHLGTLVAVALYFRRDVVLLVRSALASLARRRIETPSERVAWYIVAATVPAALAGALGEDFIVEELGEPWQIAILLAVFALVLWIADRSRAERRIGDIRLRDALTIGLAQVLALMPGVSRSGVTISAARFLALDRDSAARFSFLLLLPTTLGAVVWKGVTDVLLADLPPGSGGPFLVGTIAAAVSGLAAISVLLGYVRRHSYSLFVVYRLLVAAIVLLLIATGVREAGF
ncbi:MAG: undecaprenyl-diphosphate phosphatase [Thermoleophilia bacterium]|nr:undecaprenyl-diphosphate phosphatase [Thermoleophilia bacterium]